MPTIDHLEDHVVYCNPRPHVRSRHGFFPGVIQLASGELLALLVIGEAFESADLTSYVSRSRDLGKTWELQGPVCDKQGDAVATSDFLKPLALRDGRLMALGYRFHRHDPEVPIGIVETDGVLSGDDIVCFSSDEGRTWTAPRVIPRSIPELLEIPGRAAQLRSGDIVVTAGLFKTPQGTNPSGQFGVLLRSKDGGATWDDRGRFFATKAKTVAAYESHLCEMQPGRLVTICWALDMATGHNLPNHVNVSHDDGYTWSAAFDTTHMGQSANLLWLGDDRLMSVHCHRTEDPGLYVRVIDFRQDRWNCIEEKAIWGAAAGPSGGPTQKFHQMAKALRFGQASLLRLNNGDILATHWAIEDGQGKILSHRLRVRD